MKTEQYPEAIGTYLKSLSSLGKSVNTIKLYSAVLHRFGNYLRELGGNPDITPDTVADYRNTLCDGNLSDNSVRQHLTVIHAFFAKIEAFSRLSGRLDVNPVLRDEIPDETAPTYDDSLTSEEIRLLLDSRPKTDSKLRLRNYAIVVLFLQSGLRNSELRALTPEDLDYANHTITVKHGKGDKARQAPFPRLSREILREYLDAGIRPADLPGTAPLFGSLDDRGEWKEYNINALNALVKRYTKKVIGREIHCHLLRHAAASSWDDAGIPLRDVQKALGHSDVRTTERVYVQILNRSRAAQNISRVFDGV